MGKNITLLTLTLQKEIDHESDDEYLKKRDELIIMLEDMGFSVDIESEDWEEENPYYDDDEGFDDE